MFDSPGPVAESPSSQRADASEHETTTEDYATATENNSGTDTSSRRSGAMADDGAAGDVDTEGGNAGQEVCTYRGALAARSDQGRDQSREQGSSFESASSHYSPPRTDTEEQPQVRTALRREQISKQAERVADRKLCIYSFGGSKCSVILEGSVSYSSLAGQGRAGFGGSFEILTDPPYLSSRLAEIKCLPFSSCLTRLSAPKGWAGLGCGRPGERGGRGVLGACGMDGAKQQIEYSAMSAPIALRLTAAAQTQARKRDSE